MLCLEANYLSWEAKKFLFMNTKYSTEITSSLAVTKNNIGAHETIF